LTKSVRALTDEAFSRTAGAELRSGNRIRLLKDAAENYPAWIDAMESARRWIHFETYIIHDDAVGRRFSELLRRKAMEGVKVRLIYDWMGSLGNASRGFWKGLIHAGVDVRCFNPPSLESPFGWLSRDHRKMIAVDGEIGYISGLCVGQRWAGIPERGLLPWRDTGVEIQGPALAECLPMADRKQTRFIYLNLPADLAPGRYRLTLEDGTDRTFEITEGGTAVVTIP